MYVYRFLKTFCIGTLAISAGTAQAFPLQDAKIHAIAIPKLQGEIAQAGFACNPSQYLPWRDKFHFGGTGYIDGIRKEDLDQPIMCGIDPWSRPFIAFKYACTRLQKNVSLVTQGAAAIFQRYTNSLMPIVSGGHFKPPGCSMLGPIDPQYSETFAEDFGRFLNGEPILASRWDGPDGEIEIRRELRICNKQLCPPDVLQLPSPIDE